MRLKPLLATLPLVLCCLCVANALAQGGKVAPPVAPQPVQPQGARAVGDVSAPAGWKRYEIQFGVGQVVSLVLPSQPQVETKTVPMGTLPAATLHQLTIPTDADIYVLQYMEGLPVEVTDDRDSQTVLFKNFWSGFVDGFRNAMTQKGVAAELVLQPQREMMVGGSRVQAQDFAVGEVATGCARAVVGGGHLYALVVASRGKKLSAEGTAFLDSFALRRAR
jgi:hypothetical protein